MEKTIAGRYRLEERLGAGGMAEVWLAHDLQLDRRVALKLLGPRADRQRFEREARAIASLSHPNICRLIDYGEAHLFDEVKIDYFAVSLPDLLIWDDDLNKRNRLHCYYLIGLGLLGQGKTEQAKAMFEQVLGADSYHIGAHVHLAMSERTTQLS